MIKEIYYWCYRNLNLFDHYRSAKWFLQRLFRGHSDCDIWNMHSRLSEIIHSHLVAFKKMKRFGIPVGIANTHAISLEDEPTKGEQVASLVWEYKLDAMVEAFRIIKDDDFDIEENCPHSIFDGEKIEVGNNCVRFEIGKEKEKENDKWFKKNRVKRDIQMKKVKEGMELFVKHFQDLWD